MLIPSRVIPSRFSLIFCSRLFPRFAIPQHSSLFFPLVVLVRPLIFIFFFFFSSSLIRNENYSESMNARRNNRIYRPRQWRIHLEIAVSTFHSARSPVLDLVYVYARYPCAPNFCFNSLAVWLRAKESG